MIPLSKCAGCYDDFYNRGESTRCWSAERGKMMVRYQIHFMTAPTQKGAFTKLLKPSCYRQVNQNVFYNALPDFVHVSDLNRANRRAG
jgi:hypothetical protein